MADTGAVRHPDRSLRADTFSGCSGQGKPPSPHDRNVPGGHTSGSQPRLKGGDIRTDQGGRDPTLKTDPATVPGFLYLGLCKNNSDVGAGQQSRPPDCKIAQPVSAMSRLTPNTNKHRQGKP